MAAIRIEDRMLAQRPALGVAAALLYIFLWASAFVPSRVLARGAPPISILSLRFLVAGGLLLVGAKLARLTIPRDAKTWLWVLAVGIGGNALYLGLTYVALRQMSAGMGSIIASTNPLIMALVAPFLLREPLTGRKLIGLLLGFGGVVLTMHARATTPSGPERCAAHWCRPCNDSRRIAARGCASHPVDRSADRQPWILGVDPQRRRFDALVLDPPAWRGK